MEQRGRGEEMESKEGYTEQGREGIRAGEREREGGGARKHLIKICKDQTSRPMMLTRKK